MSKRAEEAALNAYPVKMTPLVYQDLIDQFGGKTEIDVNTYPRCLFQEGYEQAEKDTIGRAVAWLEETFFDNSHLSGRGCYGQIETNDFDSMEEMIEKFKKAMEEE